MPNRSLASLAAAALLGLSSDSRAGVIFNWMRVNSVLSVKLLAQVGYERRIGLSTSLGGILASFLLLAAALVAFRAAGAMIGWSLRFPNPLFLALAGLTALLATSLLGVIKVALPPSLMNVLARRGLGTSILANFVGGFTGHLLATPCSAPSVGTAVSFVLWRAPFEPFAVFGLLGLAAPYLMIGVVPRLAVLLRRAGRWKVRIRHALPIPLLVRRRH